MNNLKITREENDAQNAHYAKDTQQSASGKIDLSLDSLQEEVSNFSKHRESENTRELI